MFKMIGELVHKVLNDLIRNDLDAVIDNIGGTEREG